MKSRKQGFVNIPILIIVVAGLVVAGGVGLGVKKYQNQKVNQPKENVILESQDKQATSSESFSEIEKLKQEISELKKQSFTATMQKSIEPASNETANSQQEIEQLQAEKAKAEAETAKANAEQQRLQNELDAQKAKSAIAETEKQINTNTEINKGIYCNGTYWTQCTTGLEFVCPSSGNAYCRAPQSSVDLNKAANNKSELINLQNMDIAEQKKLLEYSTNEVARIDRILNQLRGYTGLVIDLSIAHRNIFIAYQNVETSMVQYDENAKRNIESLDITAFANEEAVSKLRDQINKNISDTSQKMYKFQSEVVKYNDTIRPFLPLNISL